MVSAVVQLIRNRVGARVAMIAALALAATAGAWLWPAIQLESGRSLNNVVTGEPDYPAFVMVRRVTTTVDVSTLQLDYRNSGSWRETVLSSTANPASAGAYQELLDGKLVVSRLGQTIVSEPGRGQAIPGPWFLAESMRSQRAAAASAVARATQQGQRRILTTTRTLSCGALDPELARRACGANQESVFDVAESVYDSATGIPIGFIETIGGELVEHHELVSLELN